MSPEEWAKIGQSSPYLVAVLAITFYLVRSLIGESAAWRVHDLDKTRGWQQVIKERDDRYLTMQEQIHERLNQLIVLTVLYHAPDADAAAAAKAAADYLKSGFREPSVATATGAVIQ